jgi:hypothetical protein
MAQYFNFENVPPVVKASSTSLTLATTYLGQSTVLKIGGQAYTPSSTITLNTGTTAGSGVSGIDTGTFTANTLYYVYACVSNNLPILVISTSGPSTGPTGFTSAYKYLAKFRTFVGSAAIADVNSIWVGASQDQSGQQNTEWTSFPPGYTNFSGTLTGSSYAKYRRVNASGMEIIANARISSFTSMGQLLLVIPNSYNIDTNFNTGDDQVSIVGEARYFDDSLGGIYNGHMAMTTASSTYLIFKIDNDGGGGTDVASTKPFGANWATQDRFGCHAFIPIAEWAGVFTAD